MRIIAELPHPDFKITIFHWNNRYLLKIEQGYLEQTFKIDQFDLDEKEVEKVLDKTFLNEVAARFIGMHTSLRDAIQRVENQEN